MSLVELMVGIAIGLIIVAGATVLAVSQLTENRRLLLETQVQQDLRATLDIVTRELRRAGYQPSDSYYWMPDKPDRPPTSNNLGGVEIDVAGDEIVYRYDRATASTRFAYLLTGGTLRAKMGDTAQDLTDRNTLEVVAFEVRPAVVPAPTTQMACPRLCPDGTQACWPTLEVVDLVVTIRGRAVFDSNVDRTVTSQVRVRNDAVKFDATTNQACPS